MKRSKPRGRLARQLRRRPAVLFVLVGVAFLWGVGVAIRRRSRTAPPGEGEGLHDMGRLLLIFTRLDHNEPG
jgi:hypothetical protein